jgi:hypothetical protein
LRQVLRIPELQRVALTVDVESEGLCAGDIGTVVHVYEGGRGYEVEFVGLAGDTIAVVTLMAADVRTLRPREVAQARQVA